jgi:hypothetical protein
MPYTAHQPERRETSDQLRARIPGWGADLDPADRPAVPRERFDPAATGAHWDLPERQEEVTPRERSIEHGMLPPVFGATVPLRGVSGLIRRHAYARYSEGRAAHWLLLLLGDRVDAVESHLASLATTRPDNPITESGILSELAHRPVHSRTAGRRADLKHMWLDPILVAGPWLVAGGAVIATAVKLAARVRR